MRIYDVLPPEKIKKITKEIFGIKEYKSKKEKFVNIGTRLIILISIILTLLFEFTPLRFSLSFKTQEEKKTERLYPFSIKIGNFSWNIIENENQMEFSGGLFEKQKIVFVGGNSPLIFENFNPKDFSGDLEINFIDTIEVKDAKETQEKEILEEEPEEVKEIVPKEETILEENSKDNLEENIKENLKQVDLEDKKIEEKEEVEKPEELEKDTFNQKEINFSKKIKSLFKNEALASGDERFFVKFVIFAFKNGENDEKSEFTISFSLDGENWTPFDKKLILGKKTIGFFEFGLESFDNIENLNNLKIKIETENEETEPVYFESVFLEVTKEKKENELIFDFEKENIEKAVGAKENLLFLQVEKEGNREIYLLDLKERKKEKISSNKALNLDFPIGIKDDWIFWLTEDKEEIVAFHYPTEKSLKERIPPFDCAQGERAEIKFPEISWKIILDCHNFYFSNEEIGEVFSDGNSISLERFKEIFKLDLFFEPEELIDTGFPTKLPEINETED